MSATIKDVANAASVSVVTVSKYLNNKHVSEKSSQRIQKAISDLNYQMNDIARGLRTSLSRTIGLLVPGISNIFTISLISHMEEMLADNNYSMLLCDYDYDMSKLDHKLYFLNRKKVDGVILLVGGETSEESKQLIRKMQEDGSIFVLVNGEIDGICANTVLADNFTSMYNSVKMLLEKGHTKVGLFSAPKTTWNATEREQGYRKAFDDSGVVIDEDLLYLYCEDNTWQESIKERATEFLTAHPEMTALILPGYRLTIAGLYAINRCKRNIGTDISVVGFDCAQINDILEHRLTYVSLPAEVMAEEAVNMMFSSLKDRERNIRTVRIMGKLVHGESVIQLCMK